MILKMYHCHLSLRSPKRRTFSSDWGVSLAGILPWLLSVPLLVGASTIRILGDLGDIRRDETGNHRRTPEKSRLEIQLPKEFLLMGSSFFQFNQSK
jgi:hypothetical protein